MLFDDKKQIAALIVAKAKPKSDDYEGSSAVMVDKNGVYEKNMKAGMMQAASEIMSAIESKDLMKLAKSLKNFVSMCEYDDMGEEPTEMGDTEEKGEQ